MMLSTLRSTTLGNKYKLPQQTAGNGKDGKRLKVTALNTKIITDPGTIETELKSFHCSCRSRKGEHINCVLNQVCGPGEVDRVAAAVKLVVKQRESIKLYQEKEMDNFLQEQFRRCIASTVWKKNSDGNDTEEISNYSMCYTIDEVKVCREIFAYTYQISTHRLKVISEVLKASKYGRVSSTKIRAWTDATIHDFTWSETEQLLAENLFWKHGKGKECYSILLNYQLK